MKLALIVDPYGEERPGGLGRAIYQMAKGVIASGLANECVVYVKNAPKKSLGFEGNFEVAPLLVKQLWLSAGKNLRKGSDLYVFFTPLMPLLFFPKKSIVVVHDFAYLELPAKDLKEKLSRVVLKVLHTISLAKATAVVAVSEHAKTSTSSHFGISPDKITVIYNGYIPLPETMERLEVTEPFFLFAGVLKARKNVHGVIRAFAEFAETEKEYSLVIAGKTGGAYAQEAEQLAEELGIAPRVKFVGYVTDGELRYLYTRSTALVFPSFIEGFGMPVLEAMYAGLPVITSNEGALAEVAGDAALLVDPHDPSDIARAMKQLDEDLALREAYREKGKKRAREFSWEKNAQEFGSLIKGVVD